MLNIVFFVMNLLLMQSVSVAVSVPNGWMSYIQLLIHRIELRNDEHAMASCLQLGVVIHPPPFSTLLSKEMSLSDIDQLVLPHIILWNPAIQFSNLNLVCPEGECGAHMHTTSWKYGQSKGLEPRILHDIDHTILLVSAVWSCDNGHQISSIDSRVLQVVKVKTGFQPFILLHKTGFTSAFITTVIELIQEGNSFSSVERIVKRKRHLYVTTMAVQAKRASNPSTRQSDESNSIDILSSEPICLLSHPLPSNDVYHKCLVVHFIQNKNVYNSHMSELAISNAISLDHTFKVSSNVGYSRADGKWVTLYSSVFICMNNLGQVVGWQFTSTTSIDEVSTLLMHIKNRAQEDIPLHIFVDNCCSVRNKLQGIFGVNADIKLDVFHAIQRITRKIPKRHPLFNQCKNELKLIVRDPSDAGKRRTLMTISSAAMLKNLETFEKKWKICQFNGWKVLNEGCLAELSALKVHIKKGCLSNINEGHGTNRNEALHRHINPSFTNKCRIGLPLALALLTILLYRHNINIEEKITGKPSHPIELKQNDEPQESVVYQYGVHRKCVPELSWITSDVKHSSSVDFSHLNLRDSLIHTTLQEDALNMISLQECYHIIESVINLTQVATHMKDQSCNSPVFEYRFIPFMSSVFNILLNPELSQEHDQEDIAAHTQRLHDLLRSWKMLKKPIIGDGNCCFRAVASSLKLNHKSISNKIPTFFTSMGVNDIEGVSQGELGMKLREIVVKEWQNNSQHYEGFLTNSTVSIESQKFLQSGHYNSDLGDTVLLAISNALGIPIIVFSSINNHSIIDIMPRHLRTSVPVHLAYLQYGGGHYDVALPIQAGNGPDASSLNTQPEEKPCTCACGKNDTAGDSHCQPITTKYSTVVRCKCLQAQKGCSSKCKCRNCLNPEGKRAIQPPQRKRFKHDWQEKIVKSGCFASELGESISYGPRTIFEYFLLECILKHCKTEGIDISPENVLVIYNTIFEVSQSISETLPVARKDIGAIQTFFREHERISQLYETLCITQILFTRM